MPPREVRALMWEERGRWRGRLEGAPEAESVAASSRNACLARLRKTAGREATMTVEVIPRLVGVAEAAALLGWDKRRIFTYLSRGSFPEPVAALASGRVWRMDDIEAFARTWRRRRSREAEGTPGAGGR